MPSGAESVAYVKNFDQSARAIRRASHLGSSPSARLEAFLSLRFIVRLSFTPAASFSSLPPLLIQFHLKINPLLSFLPQALSTVYPVQAPRSYLVETSLSLRDACAARAKRIKMAPAPTDSPSQADTPMSDANDDAIPSVPVDALTVGDPRFGYRCVPPLSHHLAAFGRAQ